MPPHRTELAIDTHDCLWLLTQGCERGREWHLKQSPPAHRRATVAVEHLVRNAAHFVVVVPRQLGAGTDVPETGGDWRVEWPRLRTTSTQTTLHSSSIGINPRLLNLAPAQDVPGTYWRLEGARATQNNNTALLSSQTTRFSSSNRHQPQATQLGACTRCP